MDMIFKTTMFGGFDKQDVMSYIEKTVQEYESRVSAMDKEREALQSDLSAALDRGEALAQERDSLLERCEALEQERDGLLERGRELETKLASETATAETVTQQELAMEALEAETERLRGVEREYQSIRSHMVDVELDARQRAAAIEQEAKRQANTVEQEAKQCAERLLAETEQQCQALREKARRELGDLTLRCGELRGDVSTVVSYVSGELRKADVAVSQLPLAFDKLLENLKNMETAEEE